ncbi:uncharacterized protein LOC120092141 [Benincasa hispida]|uniref:uncharacterized protein LOC120092141 n=1 Tax=Benincasa hispida TaxID=102211 RepID=UPI001902461A|nr:uncharacterized protein LOC120092141 [Benincasa hispida]
MEVDESGHCAKAKKMAPNIKWSGNKMEGGEVSKTMECLRRRLLAERQASLLAKEEAELMGKRSTELEKQITKQIQMKTKAEKKLQLLKKKLGSLNLSTTMVNSEASVSSEICDEDEPKTLIEVPSLLSNSKAIGEISHLEEENRNARGSTSSNSSASEICSDEPSKTKIGKCEKEFDSVDDSLAIVAVNSPGKSETGDELKPLISERIIEVLNDLKHARETIRSSMKICEVNMIEVSPV